MRPEYIICAASLYNELPICGINHAECIKIIRLIDPSYPHRREAQGFLTSTNRFVGRKEAYKIARANKQIWHNYFDDLPEDDERELTSEDLVEWVMHKSLNSGKV